MVYVPRRGFSKQSSLKSLEAMVLMSRRLLWGELRWEGFVVVLPLTEVAAQELKVREGRGSETGELVGFTAAGKLPTPPSASSPFGRSALVKPDERGLAQRPALSNAAELGRNMLITAAGRCERVEVVVAEHAAVKTTGWSPPLVPLASPLRAVC
jgi:hypothetical protein